MFTRSARVVAALAATSLVALLAACAAGGAADDGTPTFRMTTQSWLGYAPWYIAEENGYFDDHGVDVEMTTIDDTSAAMAAMSGGEFDGANVSTAVWLLQMTNGVSWDLVMVEDSSETADAILGGPEVSSVQDLVGKSVAFESFSTSQLLFNAALAAEGIDPASVAHVELPAGQAGGAVIAGQVEAAVTYQPYLAAAEAQDSGIEVIYTAGEQPGLISDALAIDPAYADANPDVVIALTKAWDDAVRFIEEDPEAALEIMAAGIGSSADDMRDAFDGISFATRADSASELGSTFIETTIPLTAESMVTAGMIPAIPDFARFVTDEFVTAD